jgi:hypothetical protein
MSTKSLEKINQIKLDSEYEKVYHARRTQGCGGFKLYFIDNIKYITCWRGKKEIFREISNNNAHRFFCKLVENKKGRKKRKTLKVKIPLLSIQYTEPLLDNLSWITILTVNVPVVYMMRDVMVLMRANPLQGPLEGVGPEIETFLGLEMVRAKQVPLGLKKVVGKWVREML